LPIQYILANAQVPTGKIIKFQGDISKHMPDKLGYYLLEVTAPDNLIHPIIQYPIKSNSYRVDAMVSTLGSWKMVIYSEELKNALNYGYKFNILEGIIFEKQENIFKEYVNYMYNLRKQFPKDNPLNLIAKLLMNSLYGRFGMDDNHPVHKVISKKEWNKYYSNIQIKELNNIYDTTHFNNFSIISIKKEIDTESYGFRETHNINIAIAAAITANERGIRRRI